MGWKTTEEDSLSERGAHSLARKIREFWLKRGVPVEVWAEAGRYEASKSGPSFWVVRSNINIAVLRDIGR